MKNTLNPSAINKLLSKSLSSRYVPSSRPTRFPGIAEPLNPAREEIYEAYYKVSILKEFEKRKCGMCKKTIEANTQFLMFKVSNAELIMCFVCLDSITEQATPEEIKRQKDKRTSKEVAEAL